MYRSFALGKALSVACGDSSPIGRAKGKRAYLNVSRNGTQAVPYEKLETMQGTAKAVPFEAFFAFLV